jgi:hypothetical protein
MSIVSNLVLSSKQPSSHLHTRPFLSRGKAAVVPRFWTLLSMRGRQFSMRNVECIVNVLGRIRLEERHQVGRRWLLKHSRSTSLFIQPMSCASHSRKRKIQCPSISS